MTREAANRKITQLRTEIAFLTGDAAIGGTSHEEEKKKLLNEIDEIKKQIDPS